MTSTILDKVLGLDPKDHDEPNGDAWYRATNQTGMDACVRRHDRALAARYHGRTDRRTSRAARVDPMRDVEELPVPLSVERLKLLALGLLWSIIVALAGVLIGQAVVTIVATAAVVWFGWVAAHNTRLAWNIWRDGRTEVRR